jgi:hypothetical protein
MSEVLGSTRARSCSDAEIAAEVASLIHPARNLYPVAKLFPAAHASTELFPGLLEISPNGEFKADMCAFVMERGCTISGALSARMMMEVPGRVGSCA